MDRDDTRPFRPSKAMGQNFLVDPRVAARFVDALDPGPGDAVLEVGPGTGALTVHLLAKAGRVVAIEADARLARDLAARFADHPNLIVLQGDCRDVDAGPAMAGFMPKAISNLPYSVTTPILRWMLCHPLRFGRIVVGVQKEVGQRIVAAPGGRVYGRLTILVRMWGTPRRVFDLPPGAFRPRPRVMSSVLEIVPRSDGAIDVPTLEAVEQVTRAAFSQRRKKILNALRDAYRLDDETIVNALRRSGIPVDVRAEDVDTDRYVLLSRILAQKA